VGGGSNFGGIAYPFLRMNLLEGMKTRLLAVEPPPPIADKGVYTFDYGDTAMMARSSRMHTSGMLLSASDPAATGYTGWLPASAPI